MRTSRAALAIITRLDTSKQTQYLTQWSDSWHAYSLVGGHVEPGETFRQCCQREISEELECDPRDFKLQRSPLKSLRFQEFSKAASVDTDYHWEIFIATPSKELLARLPATCQWVYASEVFAEKTAAGQPIAAQVRRVLTALDIIPDRTPANEEAASLLRLDHA
jgi:8-oxo-dGTP pyrophosphatase MutT (NUDIX family)